VRPEAQPDVAARASARTTGASSADAQPRRGLAVVSTLAEQLDRAGIRYCQFKSNWHLDQGVRGLTDLDVLVDPGAGPRLTPVLAAAGYRKFSAPPGGDYPGVEDYLAMDAASGRLVHLHLHHQLTTGEPHLKGHRFPWEDLVLETRRRDEDSGFFVSEPGIELLFLLTRNTLKVGTRDRLAAWAGRDPVPGGLTREFQWLRGRVDADRVVALGRSLLGASSEPALRDLLEHGPSPARMRALRRVAMPVLRTYRMYTPWRALIGRWRRRLQSLGVKLGRRFPAQAGPLSRTDPRGGALIAFLGPDGAGKSRLTTEIASWLRWKLDARVVYFGSGDGPSSIARWPLKLGLRLVRRLRPAKPPATEPAGGGAARGADSGAGRGARPGLARAVWALVLALEKRQTLRRARRARDRGIVIVCDRYPQNQVMGFNDGPLLAVWSRSPSRLLRALAAWESIPYVRAETDPPRLVVKLRVSPEVAIRRKPDMHPEEIVRRNAALERFRYPAGTRVVELSGDRPWESVLLEAQRAVWAVL